MPAVPAEGEREAVLASPMVGTFYRAPAPTEPPFVEVGDVVEEGRTVGVIEAMKLFNPITAELTGVVKEILVGDVEPVEFGQPLIRLAVGDDGSGAG
jgi:acetyl-CoA carboxylase biotin carboxyl carrier protein